MLMHVLKKSGEREDIETYRQYFWIIFQHLDGRADKTLKRNPQQILNNMYKTYLLTLFIIWRRCYSVDNKVS